MATAIAFVALVASPLLLLWTVTYGRSWLARERFRAEMASLRDEIEDLVFDGTLPDCPAVEYQWAKTKAVAAYPEMVSFSSVVAVVGTGSLPVKKKTPSHNELTPEQRKLMNDLDARLVKSMERHIRNGSRLWFVFPIATKLAKVARAFGRRPRNKGRRRGPTSPSVLATNFNSVMDKSRTRTPEGLRVSPKLIPH